MTVILGYSTYCWFCTSLNPLLGFFLLFHSNLQFFLVNMLAYTWKYLAVHFLCSNHNLAWPWEFPFPCISNKGPLVSILPSPRIAPDLSIFMWSPVIIGNHTFTSTQITWNNNWSFLLLTGESHWWLSLFYQKAQINNSTSLCQHKYKGIESLQK